MYSFIVNPNARSGLGLKSWNQLENILKERQVDYQVYFTRYPGQGTDFARALTEKDAAATIVILGGDGTINEVVNGISDLSAATLGYIPIGSGNDFARSMKLSKDPVMALNKILSPTDFAYINVGRLMIGENSRRYAVSSGIGFDAAVCVENNSYTRLKRLLNKIHLGKLSYTTIALHQLLSLSPRSMTITLDNGVPRSFQKVYFATAMNQRYEGGGFKFCPKANPEDDLLDIIIISGVPKLKALLLLPLAFKGLHVFFKGIHIYTCRKAVVQSEVSLPVHTDGEADLTADFITFTLENKRLKLICS